MTMISANCPAVDCPPVAPRRVSGFARLRHVLAVWRQRRTLKALDTKALRDIGVTRDQAKAEAARPIWDAPQTWRR